MSSIDWFSVVVASITYFTITMLRIYAKQLRSVLGLARITQGTRLHPASISSFSQLSTTSHKSNLTKESKHVNFAEGDWMCPSCNKHNFANNYSCYGLECNELRPEIVAARHALPKHFREGDWVCASCGMHNFVSNTGNSGYYTNIRIYNYNASSIKSKYAQI